MVFWWWCSSVLKVSWECSGGILVVWWCSGVVLVVFWCSVGVLEVLLDLLQPVLAVLDLQVNLRPLAMIPNDSPYPKTWGLKKNQISSLHRS